MPFGRAAMSDLTPVIVAFARTPIGSFTGSLKSLTAPQLGAVAIKAALARCGSSPVVPDEVFMGNVLSAGVGQAPATQAVIAAGLGEKIPSTTINKVCASGMKAVMLGAQAIALGQRSVVVCGGMESMSNVPHYLPNSRGGFRLGNATLVDGVVHDGLWDPYGDVHMGKCAEKCSKDLGISREEQDAYAQESYKRASASSFASEIAPVEVKTGKTTKAVGEDEEPSKFLLERLRSAKSAFQPSGTVTAVNASSLNDGAAALVLMSNGEAKRRGLRPLAAIRGFGDAQTTPADFTIAPSLAVPLAMKMAGLIATDVDLHEVNEAFSVVALANMRLLDLFHTQTNLHGGAVSLGHPLGMSGARIVGALCSTLKAHDKTIGVASICNGGGGASAIAIERL